MSVRIGNWLKGYLIALSLCVTSLGNAQQFFPSEETTTEAWTPLTEDLCFGLDELTFDESFEPAQMLVPQNNAPRMAQRPRRSSVAQRNPNLASVPFMIGDTGSGTCLTIGGSNTFAIEHPTLTCSRLNVSENNTPLPTDRTFVSYRHFKHVSGVRVLTAFTRDYNVDRFTLGTERTFCDGMCSMELRLPIERRLTSNFNSFVSVTSPPEIIDPFVGERQNELSNVSAMLKVLLLEKDEIALSAGLGVTVPTARDFTYGYYFDAYFEQDLVPGPPNPDVFRFDTEAFDIGISNETVYLSPFLAWLWQPHEHPRFFHQGFWQIEVAANTSKATVFGAGSSQFTTADGFFTPLQDIYFSVPIQGRSADIFAQTIMRLNLGCGYVIHENAYATWVKRLVGLLEMHYTTTIQDPIRTQVALDFVSDPPIVITPELQAFLDGAFTFGNELEHTNIVNVATGLSANVGRDGNTVVTTALILPVTQNDERAFDLEFNLQVQRLY